METQEKALRPLRPFAGHSLRLLPKVYNYPSFGSLGSRASDLERGGPRELHPRHLWSCPPTTEGIARFMGDVQSSGARRLSSAAAAGVRNVL